MPNAFVHVESDIPQFRSRLSIAALFVLSCFIILLGRLIWLQVVEQRYYTTLADNNRIAPFPVLPARGIIQDRYGVILAHNYSAYTLELLLDKIPSNRLVPTIDELSTVVEITPGDRRRFLRLLEDNKRVGPLPIRNHLSEEDVARFTANRFRFPGVEINARLFRTYPQQETASHILGHMGRINQNDLDYLDDINETDNYVGTSLIGKLGIERYYESILHGQSGFDRMEIDAGGHPVRTLSHSAAKPGKNIGLTIDVKLQQLVETAFGDRQGALVAIDPRNGEVLAFVSMPRFNPNLFVAGIDQHNWDTYNNDPDKPLLNRALRGQYPPGSTYKPFMALAALATGKRTPEQTIQDPGYFMFGAHKFRDDKPEGHGSVNMYTSIVQSCDTYYYTLARDLGVDSIHDQMSQWGFGKITGIDLLNEAQGILPSPAWKEKRFHQKWFPGETISLGIGQGYNAFTPLQMAYATAAIAGRGRVFKPHLLRTITDPQTRTTQTVPYEPAHVINVPDQNISEITRAMIGVTKEGTAAQAFARVPYTVAGKTGTAQVVAIKANEKYVSSRVAEKFHDHAWFIAFAPAEAPQIALAVIVENGGFGAQAAAPIARQVLDYVLLSTTTTPPHHPPLPVTATVPPR